MDDTKARILNAAGQTFATKGFAAATVREICNLAGANIAAVNYYFHDKHQLYLESVRAAECGQQTVPQFEWTPKTPRDQKLADFIRHMMKMMLDRDAPDWHLELMMREMARPTAACTDVVQNFIGPTFNILVQILDEFLPPETPIRDRHIHAFSIVGQCLLYRYQRNIGRMLLGEEEYQALMTEEEYLADHVIRWSLAALNHYRQTPSQLVESPSLETPS